jgi:hypothetical protein
MDGMVQGKRVEIRLSPEQVMDVDEWRRHYAEDLPPRAEAIVRLMEIGLKAEGHTPGKLVRPAKGARKPKPEAKK